MEERPVPAQTELLSLRAQLTSTISLQIEKIRAGITTLERHLKTTAPLLKEHFIRTDGLCKQADGLFDNYGFIKNVSRAHNNIAESRKFYEQFKKLEEHVGEANALLLEQQEAELVDPKSLLLLHFRLAGLEDFRRQTMGLLEDSPQSVILTVKRYFQRLDDLSTRFNDFFWSLAPRFEELLEEHPSAVIAALKVITRMPDREAAKARILKTLEAAVEAKFKGFGTRELSEMLGGTLTELYSSNLNAIRLKYAPCFPPEWNITDFYISAYHKGVCRYIAQAVVAEASRSPRSPAANGSPSKPSPAISKTSSGKSPSKPSPAISNTAAAVSSFARLKPATLLKIINWYKGYHDFLSQFAVSADNLQPKLLDGRMDDVQAEYVRQSSAMVAGWIRNLQDTEVSDFMERRKVPELDPDNHYFTSSAIDLFQIVKQSVDTALEVSRGRLGMEITRECCRSVGSFQQAIITVMKQQTMVFIERPDEASKFCEDYLIMEGNSAIRWITYVGELQAKVAAAMEEEWAGQTAVILKECQEGFMEVSKVAAGCLVDITFAAVKSVTDTLFTAEWYEQPGAQMSTVTATFDDFFHDYQDRSEDFMFKRLVAESLDRLIYTYLEGMRGKTVKFRMETVGACFAADLELAQSFYSERREPARVERALDALLRITSLVSTDARMIFLEFFGTLKVYPDLPLWFIEDLLGKRDDLERSEVKQQMDAIKKRIKEEGLSATGTGPATVFARLTPPKRQLWL